MASHTAWKTQIQECNVLNMKCQTQVLNTWSPAGGGNFRRWGPKLEELGHRGYVDYTFLGLCFLSAIK